jgi:hypothetical protein
MRAARKERQPNAKVDSRKNKLEIYDVKAIPDQVDSLGHLLTPLPALAQGGGGGGSGGGSAGGASAGGEVTPRSEPKIRRSIRRSKASAKGAEQRRRILCWRSVQSCKDPRPGYRWMRYAGRGIRHLAAGSGAEMPIRQEGPLSAAQCL